MTLAADTAALLDVAVDELGAHHPELVTARQRLAEPLRVAIAGKVKAGKSTLLNALVGEQLAPTDAGECTRIVTWYRNGHTYRVDAVLADNSRRQLRFDRADGAIEVDLGDLTADDIASLDVLWPSSRLAEITLIDTPGIESIHADVSQRSVDFLTGDETTDSADAVLYLMRHAHRDDVRFLESFHDREVAHGTPVNSIGVLSRADEIGSCRRDAMTSARRIADRYRREPKLRRLCQTVVPVAGLLAQGAATLRELEFRQMATLASQSDESLRLHDVGDFIRDDPRLPITAIEREDLLDRLGLFGIRVGIDVLRRGTATTADTLARRLFDASGLPELRQALLTRFAARADALRARSSLAVLERVLLDAPAAPVGLAAGHERLVAGAHEFAELRLLNELHLGMVSFRDDDLDAAEAMLTGATPQARLGIDDAAGLADVRNAAGDMLDRWRSKSESPMASQGQRDASRVIVRSLEGLITAASPPSSD
ncbi:MAG: dynamin family protein [Actinomycetota bacterium]